MDNVFIKNGVYLGVSKILIFLMDKFFYPRYSVSVFVALIELILLLYFMYKSIEDIKSSNYGNVSFDEGFKTSWLTAAVGITMYDFFVRSIYAMFKKMDILEFFYGIFRTLIMMPGNFIQCAIIAGLISYVMKKEGTRFKL